MVCKKCEKKLSTLATTDPFASKNSSTSSSKPSSSSTPSTSTSTRKLNENKLLSSKKSGKFNPYAAKCKVCKQTVHQAGRHYCQGCAYKNGICAMCGVQILDTAGYKMASK
ncbi:PDZ-binding protein [Fimicolochytrium jonesii]|uniref:PDZ-binding protein n=1 Tax=Fimicolochytrium jonesii TaxID=1396493 RepID=UPI0022FE334B|nr:PDZ-binding protein [Fimicolochytrium jonesii]KAI8824418.1 PDZ-binding protein [Fimicolochytrium jonesii]